MTQKTFKDLTGQVFGELTALSYKGDSKWECQCSCGNTKVIHRYSLIKGKTKSCGRCTSCVESISAGDTFGEWTVTSLLPNQRKAVCRCSCGVNREVSVYSLLNDKSTSCGHTMNKDRIVDIKGQKFGELTAIEYAGNSTWLCRCSCGAEIIKRRDHLLDGRSASCGHDIDSGWIDLTNTRFGKLVANNYVGNKAWLCTCDCGQQKIILATNLRNGSTISCGCIQYIPEKDYLVQKILEYTDDNGRKPSIKDMADLEGVKYKTMTYHLAKHNLSNTDYMDTSYSSEAEREIYNYIRSICNLEVLHNVWNIINPYELDIYIPEKKLAIEFNGDYWHSSINKEEGYHQKKTLNCFKKGIRLIHIFEYEWEDSKQQEKINQMLKSILKPEDNCIIHGRNTIVTEISEKDAFEFCNTYHLSNGVHSKINLGLTYKSELVGVMTFGKTRFEQGIDWELLRLTYKGNKVITGGAQKLFNAFITKYKPQSIVSYCDISKFTGRVYTQLGFSTSINKLTKPNYIWKNLDTREELSRYQTQVHKLIELGLGNKTMTENEIMEGLGFIKINDCGNLRFTWHKGDN